MPLSEVDIAKHVLNWLDGYEHIYQEVEAFGRVADIVVDVAGLAWVIEVKRSLGMAVFEQADHWVRIGVPRVSIAYLRPKRGTSQFAI